MPEEVRVWDATEEVKVTITKYGRWFLYHVDCSQCGRLESMVDIGFARDTAYQHSREHTED